jgi:hypothetical protein
MTPEIKNRILDFIELVISTHDEKYPSCEAEENALIEAISAEFRISKDESVKIWKHRIG